MYFKKALQYSFFGKALNTLLVFVINLLLVRILGVQNSGLFFYSITMLGLFMLLLSCSLESGIIYHASKNENIIAPITAVVFPWLIILGVVSTVLLREVHLYFTTNLAVAYVLSNLIILYFTALFYAKKWFGALNFILVAVNFVLMCLLWYEHFYKQDLATLTQRHYFSAVNLYVYTFCVQAVLLILYFLIRAKIILLNPFKNIGLVKNIFKYSLFSFISNILFFLVTRIDYFFVQHYCTEDALSNYIQVSKLGQLFFFLPTVIATVIFPYSSANEDSTYVSKVQLLCRIIVWFFIFAFCFVVLTGYWLFPWLFGKDFGMMYTAMLYYLPGFFSLSIVTLLAAYLAGKGMIKTNLVATITTLIIVVTGDVILIPNFGINGAALVSSLGYFVCMLYLLCVYKIKMQCVIVNFFAITRKDFQLAGLLKKVKAKGENNK
jgi:O-antigen/teichoic acid export membrane protein